MATHEPAEPVHPVRNAAQAQHNWHARQAPDGDFIVHGDGRLSVMDLVRSSAPPHLQWWELLRAQDWTPTDWTDVDTVLASCAFAGSRALAGESSGHGSIGWVALTSDDDQDTLQWLAISPWSNPFREVTLNEQTVTAVSTLDHVWSFPRDAPHEVAIARAPVA